MNSPKFYSTKQPFKIFTRSATISVKILCKHVLASLAIAFGMMSILKYLRPTKEKLELPDPNGSLSGSMPSSVVSSANAKVKNVLENKRVLAVKGLI